MNNLPALRDLQLTDLMLDSQEALKLLDHICYSHCSTMNKLVLINISKTQCPLLHAGVFLNLQVRIRHFDVDCFHFIWASGMYLFFIFLSSFLIVFENELKLLE